MSEVAVALNRFGLGAKPGDIVTPDVKRWLIDQFDRYDARPAALSAVPTSAQAAADLARCQQTRRQTRALYVTINADPRASALAAGSA